MRIAIVLTARPSYAKLKTVIAALVARGVDVQIIACASALLERYGKVADVVRQDFPEAPIHEIYSVYEGATLLTSVKETGSLASELGSVLCALRARAVVCVADRHEVLGVAQAAAYQHLPLIHLQGGERTGSIDDKVRDSITQLADVHCVATKRAVMRVYGLTGCTEHIHWTGCPSIDLAKQAMREPPVTVDELGGAGQPIDLNQPFVVVLQHPVTNEVEEAAEHMRALICRQSAAIPLLIFWPGEDAGSGAMAKVIRQHQHHAHIHTVRNLPPSRFLRLLTQASCLVGNSSAGIRECSYLGVPVVNVGHRQHGRERGPNVMDVDYDGIYAAVGHQIEHGKYKSSTLYGRGDSGERIAEVIGGL